MSCEHAKELKGKDAEVYQLAKICFLTNEKCWNWSKPAAVSACETRKRAKQ